MISIRDLITVTALSIAAATGAWAAQGQPGKPVKLEIKPSQIPRELYKMDKRLAEISRDLRVPGLAVAVVANDRLVFLQTPGTRHTTELRHITRDTVFYLAACTKPFVAAALVALDEDGKLDLDAPIKKYLPKFETPSTKVTESLTVRDLLSYATVIDSDRIVWLEGYTGEITDQRFYQWLRRAHLPDAPTPSTINYSIAGRIITAVTGESWKNYLRKRIFIPTGMTGATCHADKMYAGSDVATPTVRRGSGYVPARVRKTDRTMHGGGGMGANIGDLVRWLRLNMNGGKIEGEQVLSRGGVAAMHKLHTTSERRWSAHIDRTTEGFGLGWSIGTYRNHQMISQSGTAVGAAAHISFMPEDNLAIAVVTNVSGANADVIAMEIYDRLLAVNDEDLLPRYTAALRRRLGRRTEEEILFENNPVTLGGVSQPGLAYSASYSNDSWGTVTLKLINGKLTGRLGDLSMRFGSDGTDQFLVDYGLRKHDKCKVEMNADGRIIAIEIDHVYCNTTVRYDRPVPAKVLPGEKAMPAGR